MNASPRSKRGPRAAATIRALTQETDADAQLINDSVSQELSLFIGIVRVREARPIYGGHIGLRHRQVNIDTIGTVT